MIGPHSGPMLPQAVSALGPPSGVRVWLACGRTDMRKGMDGLAMLAQQVLKEDPFGGTLFAFRGRRGGIGQAALVRRPGPVPVQQAIGARPLRLAGDRYRPRRR